MRKKSKILTVLMALLIVAFALSAAIAAPMLWRGWYVLQAKALGLSESTGWSMEVILGAYDEVMGCLVWGRPFGTGELPCSEAGKNHFLDCQVLFQLDLVILTVTAALLLAVLIASLVFRGFREMIGPSAPKWALFFTAVVLAFLAVWAVVDFDGLFTLFHRICFPGKTNWVFDWRTDPIILILPERFWANTAALVAALALALELLLALLWRLLGRLAPAEPVYDQLRRLR